MTTCPYCGADLKPVFRSIAARGGKAARGSVKRTHTPAEYKEMQRKSVEAKKRKALLARLSSAGSVGLHPIAQGQPTT